MLSRVFFKLLAPQYKRPSGLLGKFVAGKMDALNSIQNDWVLSLLRLTPTDHVLEVGYGTGKTLQKISKIVTKGKIVGIDLSKDMYEAASQLLANEISDGQITLLLKPIEDASFPDESFTKILAVHVMYFWQNLAAVCALLYRVAARRGLVAIYFVSPTIAKTSVFHEYTEDEIIQSLKNAGFSQVYSEHKKFGQQNGICVLAEK